MNILIASTNTGKISEYEALLAEVPGIKILGLMDVGLGDMDVVEDGDTFEANARLKAVAYANASGKWALADDSGLCIDALDGAPGIYSARYGGVSSPEQCKLILSELEDVPDEKRTAYFMCSIALADPTTLECHVVHGKCEGHITHEVRDDGHGFGYDPIFMPNGHDRTFAQMPKSDKSTISHRGLASAALVPILLQLIS